MRRLVEETHDQAAIISARHGAAVPDGGPERSGACGSPGSLLMGGSISRGWSLDRPDEEWGPIDGWFTEAVDDSDRPASVVYVWGCGPILDPTLRSMFVESAYARRFAVERGWTRDQAGAWAMECALPLALSDAIGRLEHLMRSELSIIGWGGQTASSERRDPPIGLAAGTLSARINSAILSARANCRRLAAQRERLAQLRAEMIDIVINLPKPGSPPALPSWQSTIAAPSPPAESAPLPVSSLPDLPGDCFEQLNDIISEAHHLAVSGRLVDAYSLLLQSLHAAEQDREQGFAWTPEITRIYRLAIDNFVSRYRVPFE